MLRWAIVTPIASEPAPAGARAEGAADDRNVPRTREHRPASDPGPVLVAAARLRVTRGKPGFVDAPGDEAFNAILRTLERVHPDLETLLRLDPGIIGEDVARKLALCFRQIGAAVVRRLLED